MNEIKSILINMFEMEEGSISENKTLDELGLDSISIVELQSGLEATLGLPSESLSLMSEMTLEDIEDSIERLKK
ncbi:acyl carrier protein [Halomonas sp. IOP_14]|uniref:acyl carrier protein n=1 Tax=Halomonas sp. IOP_14 TaxID=2873295 RepID=UPI001E505768|nr:phosphopantetheine-binding protein [Halomonas sp. IOP_14]MCD1588875.1 acyl carrier protein [Halomonas sp. IOP_14]|tara:strand:+ start:557 stop:778 length:222 start_codon:yes stop_codon:yes gene_type:complete